MGSEIAAIAMCLIGFALLIISYFYRVKGKNSYFELFFFFGGLVVLAGIYTLFLKLDSASSGFAGTILAAFSAVMWGYVILLAYFFIRLILLLFEFIKSSLDKLRRGISGSA